ncbi:MAG: S-adenosylmethionine-binding domain-containing protein, partial [Micrococcales bacterium]|nr:S-adenosylmethionine-binding domain-containing protein [Micrococcales bacterium]
GPHLELFARYPREGWTAWGDEASSQAEPRGKTHRGYAGGPILTPVLAPHQRLQPGTQQALGQRMKNEYEAGLSIRDLAAQTGYSITRVRSLLTTANASFRAPGRHISIDFDPGAEPPEPSLF